MLLKSLLEFHKVNLVLITSIFALLKTSAFMPKMKAKEYILLQQGSCKLKIILQLFSWRSL